VGPPPELVAGPSSETRKKAEGMKYSFVELNASVAELWSLAQRARVREDVEIHAETGWRSRGLGRDV
jgi:starvation-inducible outer membrane lipoprotein